MHDEYILELFTESVSYLIDKVSKFVRFLIEYVVRLR